MKVNYARLWTQLSDINGVKVDNIGNSKNWIFPIGGPVHNMIIQVIGQLKNDRNEQRKQTSISRRSDG